MRYVPTFSKVYEMMLVRHGFMIVGDPLSGKSTAWKMLAEAFEDCEKLGQLPDSAHKVLSVQYYFTRLASACG